MCSHCSPADLHCAPRKWNHENPYSGYLPNCQTLGTPPRPWTDSDHLHHGIVWPSVIANRLQKGNVYTPTSCGFQWGRHPGHGQAGLQDEQCRLKRKEGPGCGWGGVEAGGDETCSRVSFTVCKLHLHKPDLLKSNKMLNQNS